MNARLKCLCGCEIEVRDGSELLILAKPNQGYTPADERVLEIFRQDHLECVQIAKTHPKLLPGDEVPTKMPAQ